MGSLPDPQLVVGFLVQVLVLMQVFLMQVFLVQVLLRQVPLVQVPSNDLEGMFRRARPLLQANLGGWFRTTRVDRRTAPAPKDGVLYVYGREGEPCRRCDSGKVQVGFQGLQNRVTYWCDQCQAGPSSSM